jgi:hypothetical protein
MKKAIFTVEEYNGVSNAGPKAKVDIDHYLSQEGFQVIHQRFQVHSKIQKFKDAFWTIPHLFDHTDQFGELIFQYPTYSSFLMRRLIPKLRSNADKLYFVIHDVESLRIFSGNKDYWQGERSLLNSSDGLIVHNAKMAKWLKDNGVTVPMVELGVFDYDNPQDLNKDMTYRKEVCYAGNLFKSSFLDKIELADGKLQIFGSHPSDHYHQGVEYMGQFTPEELPKHLTQNFGLVWDGDVLDTCGGKYGDYMRYNNPHKISLYLSSGLPVMIWKQAAEASFIVDNQLGIAVDSLENLDQELANVSEEQFAAYKKNVLKIAEKLRSGYFIKQAVAKLEKL